MSQPPSMMMHSSAFFQVSLQGDIDQQLRYVLMPELLSFIFFFQATRDRDKEIKIIDGHGKRTAPLEHIQTII